MEFTVVQRFACSPEQYWSRARGDEYEAAIAKEAEVSAELLAPRVEGGRTVQRMRITQLSPLPPVAQKALGIERFRYVQEVEADEASRSTRWAIVPEVMADRVTCRGESAVTEAPGGCQRTLRGNIEVRIPFVGGTIERHIAEQVQRSYTRAESVIRRFVEVP